MAKVNKAASTAKAKGTTPKAPKTKSLTGASAPAPKKAKAPAAPAAEVAAVVGNDTQVHGTTLSFGDLKRGGTIKAPLVAVLPRKSIKIAKGFNPRSVIGTLTELVDSIKKEGIISPLLVRPGEKDGEFLLVCGERRYRAAEQLGLESLPVLIRSDLAGKDDDARAVAVAENSEDGRQNLNPIELGTVFARLANVGWTVGTIASNCGTKSHTVRRCLALMDAPEDVQKRVSSGELSANTGLEVAKLDPSTRAALKDALKGDLTPAEVRRLAKTVASENPDAAAASTDGKAATRKTGPARDASLVVWRQAKTKQGVLAKLCHAFVNATDEEKGTPDYYEMRGALGILLWDRGDLADEEYLLPPMDSDEPAVLKALKRVDALIAKEAKKYTPEPAAADEAEAVA